MKNKQKEQKKKKKGRKEISSGSRDKICSMIRFWQPFSPLLRLSIIGSQGSVLMLMHCGTPPPKKIESLFLFVSQLFRYSIIMHVL